jgi:hypothetical protein
MALMLAACGGGGGSSGGGTTGGGGPGNPPPPPAPELGTGDHTPSSVTFTTIAVGGISYNDPMDLDFSNATGKSAELWIVNRASQAIVIIDNATGSSFTGDFLNQSDEVGAWTHFLSFPSGIAMGAQTSSTGNGWTFGTSQDSNNGGNNFMGPSLWSADRTVIGQIPSPLPAGWNTSHLDMLHSTTFAKGMAHETGNIYWTVGVAYFTLSGTPQVCVSRFDFATDHGPGMDDHADGLKWHYMRGQVATVAGVHTGLEFDAANSMLYIADTGNGRILRLQTNTGSAGGQVSNFAADGTDREVTGATVTTIVDAGGLLTRPSGLTLRNNLIYVADNATGHIHAFNLSGVRVNWLDTGLGANALQGIAFGPDGKLYFCDKLNDTVRRIDP